MDGKGRWIDNRMIVCPVPDAGLLLQGTKILTLHYLTNLTAPIQAHFKW